MKEMDKKSRKSAVDKKLSAEPKPDMEGQAEMQDMANGMDDMPPAEAEMSEAPEGGMPDPNAAVGELALAVESLIPLVDENLKEPLSQVLSILQSATGADSGMEQPMGDVPEEGEDLMNSAGGLPVPAGR